MKKTILFSGIILIFFGLIFYIFYFVKNNEGEYSVEKLSPIVVESPKKNSRVQSPLMIRGKAKGNWFFEASFPILLKNKFGDIIVSGIARAEGDWMTEQYVPFSSELVFSQQEKGSAGTLILKKDNPSGLPEYDDSISIPIAF